MEDIGWKIGYVCFAIVIITMIIMGTLVITDINSRSNLCESKGFDYYHMNAEKGYVACCKSILKDHINTDETICKAFKED